MAVSFLKWPGGKRWLISNYVHVFPDNFNCYIEPFLGGGSVFFHLEPNEALIADINPELTNTYKIMRQHPEDLRNRLIMHQNQHSREHFYAVRDNVPTDSIERAARFIYLNRSCFNGMYRVNRQGQFNVPIGTKHNFIYDVLEFENYSQLLQNVSIRTCDFVETICCAQDGDLVFADPPYTIAHNQNSFIKYNEKLFSWKDQHRLISALSRARNRGATILSTNANYPDLRIAYERAGFRVYPVQRYSSISGLAQGRGHQEELLISSNDLQI